MKDPAMCKKCKHDRFIPDLLDLRPEVKRLMPGNGICAKCGEPAPVTFSRAEIDDFIAEAAKD